MVIDQDIEPAHKRQRLDITGGESVDSGEEECVSEIVFALDYSSVVSDDDFKRELNFVQDLARSWNFSTELRVVVYGHDAKTLSLTLGNEQVFHGKSRALRKETWAEGKNRRIDRALSVAAENFSAGAKSGLQPHKVVVMITAGGQQSDAQKKDNHRLLVKAHEVLSERNIKVIIVPVGLHTDFKELGLIVKRPQSLYPLCGFGDMTLDKARGIARNIKETLDIETYAKKQLFALPKIPQGAELWENISLCSDALEGAWYLLYDDQKKPRKYETVKKFIRESIDTFFSTLVTESKIRISLAVFGPLGAGKSYFVNSLLKWGLGLGEGALTGPLPSSSGGSQTPIPIYVRYGRSLQVFLHSCSNEKKLLLQEADVNAHTLVTVENVLKTTFKDKTNFLDAKYVEIEGQFPVFHHLKEETRSMTQSGHLKLEVDVEFVDLPGCGDERGNESINLELSKADVVLFFDWGKSGRPVSAEDIAQVFRRRDEFKFTTRPKLVHVSNEREVSVPPSDEKKVIKEKKEDLEKAWSTFLSSSGGDEGASDCYQDVRAKLPQLTGEALLEKLSSESDVLYFHSGSAFIVESLKNIIKNHVGSVMIKEKIHPFLKHIHLAAKKLKTRAGNIIATSKTKHAEVEVNDAKVMEISTSFDIIPCENNASDLISEFLQPIILPLDLDLDGMQGSICEKFFGFEDTKRFLLKLLTESLESFTDQLIYDFREARRSMLESDASDLSEVVEIMCDSRAQQFCAYSASLYLHKIVDKEVNRNRRYKEAMKAKWSNSDSEERKEMCATFLNLSLESVLRSLGKRTRQLVRGSHFEMIERLKRDVQGLLRVRNANKTDSLRILMGKLPFVIEFCNKAIRDINPHPSLDVQTDVSIPEKMVDAHEGSTIPSQSNHEKIINEMTEILLKPGIKRNDSVHKLETKLKCKHGDLQLRETQGVDQLEWAKALIIVLSDKDHFNVELNPSLELSHGDKENERLLNFARKRLFAYQKSRVTCKMVINDGNSSIPDDEIHVMKISEEKSCLRVLVSLKMSNMLHSIRDDCKDPAQELAPIFIPSIRPGPSDDIRGNYFLEDDPWSKRWEDGTKDESEKQQNALNLSIFLVVEKHQVQQFRDTIKNLKTRPSNVNLVFIVLPQEGRGIGVTRAIIKSLAECFKFSLYWTIDDDIQFMYQFDENDRRWHKCALTRGLLFGQRVFQTCLEKTVKELSDDDRDELFEDVTSNWPPWAKKTKRRVRNLITDQSKFAEVQRNPARLHFPSALIAEDCSWDKEKEEELRECERQFVEICRKRLYEKSLNHIAGISLAHESTRRYDYMSKYPKADYMQSEQRYQIVLNNVWALKGRNFVTDEMIFREEENQVCDRAKRNTPYWGVKGSDKSFCRALKVSGVIGYQVIRIVHSHKRLRNVFDKVAPSYIGSQSPHRSEEEEEDEPQAGPSHIQS
ncbi:uncharacterized protein [Acropora muricata]